MRYEGSRHTRPIVTVWDHISVFYTLLIVTKHLCRPYEQPRQRGRLANSFILAVDTAYVRMESSGFIATQAKQASFSETQVYQARTKYNMIHYITVERHLIAFIIVVIHEKKAWIYRHYRRVTDRN